MDLKNLIIDIGNSRLKAAIFRGPALVQDYVFDSLEDLVQAVPSMIFDHVILSSVRWTQEELNGFLPFPYTFLSNQTPLPIQNLYGSPETLGMDRIAAVVGALNYAKEGPVLAIDLGTCITYDFLDAENNYLGGAISPGIDMRFGAMHANTSRLPLERLNGGLVELIGTNTQSCLQSGVQNGVKSELEGIIVQYKRQYKHLRVFICGGDSKFFESLTKDYIFVIPNLILHGLNRILTYNVHKK